jgi:hypothetical protein
MSGAEEYRPGDGLLVHVSPGGTAYALNQSAAAIWQLCDGARTVEEITEELGQWVGRSTVALLPDVIEGVAQLHALGLLELP